MFTKCLVFCWKQNSTTLKSYKSCAFSGKWSWNPVHSTMYYYCICTTSYNGCLTSCIFFSFALFREIVVQTGSHQANGHLRIEVVWASRKLYHLLGWRNRGCQECLWYPQFLSDQLTLFQPADCRLCPPIITGPSWFLDFSTALNFSSLRNAVIYTLWRYGHEHGLWTNEG